MVDYEILEDIPHYGQNVERLERRYTCPAMGLFYVKRSGDIVPIAIQFYQEPSEINPIWTPNDSAIDWIYAKMWLRNADTQWHQVCNSCLVNSLSPLKAATSFVSDALNHSLFFAETLPANTYDNVRKLSQG